MSRRKQTLMTWMLAPSMQMSGSEDWTEIVLFLPKIQKCLNFNAMFG